MAEVFSIFEDKRILKTTALIFESQSGPLLWYVHSMYIKKTQKFGNEQGFINRKEESERTLMYLLFPLSGIDPRVHLGNSLWKVSNVVAKYHRH